MDSRFVKQTNCRQNNLFNIYYIDKYKAILLIMLAIALALRIVALIQLSPYYNLNNDDMNYIRSAKTFMQNFSITLGGKLTAQIMPGMTWLLSIFLFLFGYGDLFWLAIKIFWILMGLASIYGVYKLTCRLSGQLSGLISAAFMLSIDYVWMDNIILTETPFMLLFIFLLEQSVAFVQEKKMSYFWGAFICYFLSIIIRPNLVFYPIIFGLYLLINKVNIKNYLRQISIAIVCLLIFFIPWIIRNYIVFTDFIPFTYGIGNPLLRGTYQGVGFPKDSEINYETEVRLKLPSKIINGLNEGKNSSISSYYGMHYDEAKAKYRIIKWWKQNKYSFIKSYLFLKPLLMIKSSFLWTTILGVNKTDFVGWRIAEFILFIISFILCVINKKTRINALLLFIVFFILLGSYSCAFAFDRYIQTAFFIEFVMIGCGCAIAYNFFTLLIKKFCFRANEIK